MFLEFTTSLVKENAPFQWSRIYVEVMPCEKNIDFHQIFQHNVNTKSNAQVKYARWLTTIRVPKGQASRDVWGHATPEHFKIERL